jgi:hypothetical protein
MKNFRESASPLNLLILIFMIAFVSFLTFDYVQPLFKKEVVGLKVNTIGKTIKQLKIFLKDRVRRKITQPIDLTDNKVPDEESDAIYLSFDEIAAIYRTNLDLYPDLIADRNRFVVACLTGLRFSDSSLIEPQYLRNGLLYKKQKNQIIGWSFLLEKKRRKWLNNYLGRIGRFPPTRILTAISR